MNRIIFQVVLVIVSVVLFFSFIDPLYTKETGVTPSEWGIKRLQDEIKKYNSTLADANSLIDERDKLDKKKNAISESEMARLEKLLPDSIDNIQLIIDINNIALPYGLVPKNINVAGNDQKPGNKTNSAQNNNGDAKVVIGGNDIIGSVTIAFSVSARYDTFKEFMHDLENSLRLVDVTDLSVTAGDKEFYEFNVTLKTYWLR